MEVNRYADILYLDFPIIKRLTPNGELRIYKNSDALAQAIHIWLASSRGEKIRTTGGGILQPFIGKPLDDDYAQKLKQNIQLGLTNDFSPPLEVIEVNVIPNSQKNRWEISVVAYNADLAIGVNTFVAISNVL